MKRSLSILSIAFAAFAFLAAPLADAADAPSSKKKQTQLGLYLTAKEAHDMLSAKGQDVTFIDVRTPAELAFVGMTDMVDANIPYMLPDFTEWDEKRKSYKMVPNSGFEPLVGELMATKGKDKSSPVIVMCRSGSRSSKAADLLAKAGYTQVFTVIDGFEGDKVKDGPKKNQRVVNGWKNSDLPWSYKLSENKIYTDL